MSVSEIWTERAIQICICRLPTSNKLWNFFRHIPEAWEKVFKQWSSGGWGEIFDWKISFLSFCISKFTHTSHFRTIFSSHLSHLSSMNDEMEKPIEKKMNPTTRFPYLGAWNSILNFKNCKMTYSNMNCEMCNFRMNIFHGKCVVWQTWQRFLQWWI